MKYKDIFKKWHFWTVTTILTALSAISNYLSYGSVYPAETAGFFIGSFIICCIIYFLVLLPGKVLRRFKR
jgi:hypothetical protein